MAYKCDNCKRVFERKNAYSSHMRRTNKCVFRPVLDGDDADMNDSKLNDGENESFHSSDPQIPPLKVVKEPKNAIYKCHCGRAYTQSYNLNRHMRMSGCDRNMPTVESLTEKVTDLTQKLRNVNMIIEDYRNMNEILLVQVEELRNRLTSDHGSSTKIENNTDNSITNNSITNNVMDNSTTNTKNDIYIISFGKEDMSQISDEKLLECFQQGFNSAAALTEAVHFNPDLPQNHNVYISDLSRKYGYIHKEGRWQVINKQELVDKLYNSKHYFMEDNIDTYKPGLRPSQINGMNRWFDQADNDENYGVKRAKSGIKMILYNDRNMPMNMRDAAEKKTIKETKASKDNQA